MNDKSKRYIVLSVVLMGALIFQAPLTFADPYPPYWTGGGGAAIHWEPIFWPDEADWTFYTRYLNPIRDQRTIDPSHGGARPQNYVNVSSGCPDQSLPSVYWAFDSDSQTLLFRWRVEQIANNYALGPTPGVYQNSSAWNSAQWTVMIDTDGDGFREYAVHIDGSTGVPATPVDILRGLYSDTPYQSVAYFDDPDIYMLAHNPSAFVEDTTDIIINFNNMRYPSNVWPNGTSELVWDYGTTRSMDISTPSCIEYYVDYQIPIEMLDASGVGGPTITENTPIALFFSTANSLNDPFQKDLVFEGDLIGCPTCCVPFGDLITLASGVIVQPVVDWVTADGCGPVDLLVQVRDTIEPPCGASVLTVDFYYYYDNNANGLADDGNNWTAGPSASEDPDNPGLWTASWDTTALPKGQYLLGIKAEDDQSNVTWSYLTQAEVDVAHPGDYANPDPEPGVIYTIWLNTCGENANCTKSVSPQNTTAGANVTFTIDVNNYYTVDSLTLNSITDHLPPGFSYIAGTMGGSLAPFVTSEPANGQQGDIVFGISPAVVIAPGAPPPSTETLTFQAQTSSIEGSYTNTATASTTEEGELDSNPVDIYLGTPRATINKTSDVPVQIPGNNIVYTITYSNDNPVTLTNVVVTDDLPEGLGFVSATDDGTYDGVSRTITWDIGTLFASSGPYTVSFTASVDDPYPDASPLELINTATITSTEAPDESDTAMVYINAPRPVLNINKSPNMNTADPAVPDQIQYTIIYQNTGQLSATGATVTDTTPVGFTYISHTGGASSTVVEDIGDGIGDDDGLCEALETCTVTWNLADPLTPGATGTLTLTVQIDNPYTGANPAPNTATIDSNETEPVSDTADVGIIEYGCSPLSSSRYYYHDTFINVGVVTSLINGPYTDVTLVEMVDATVVLEHDGVIINGTTATVQGFLTMASSPKAVSSFDVVDATNAVLNDWIIVGGTTVQIIDIVGTTITVNQKVTSLAGDPIYHATKLQLDTAVSGNTGDSVYALQRLANIIEPTAASSTIVQTPQADTALPFLRFYQDPPQELTGGSWNADVAYWAQKTRGNPTVEVYLYDFNPSDSTRTLIAWNTNGGAGGGVTQYRLPLTLNGDPTVVAGHLLMWEYRISGNGATIDFHYDDSPNNPPSSTNYTSYADFCIKYLYQLAIEKSVDMIQAQPGDTLTYTINFSNSGVNGATGTQIVDTIPTGTAYVAGSTILNGVAAPDPTISGQELTFPVNGSGDPAGTISYGGSGSLVFQVTVDNPLGDNIISLLNIADLESNESDPVTDTAMTDVLRPNLSIQKSADVTLLNPGDTVTYSLLIINSGDATANSVVVTDTLPEDTYFNYVPGSTILNAVPVVPDPYSGGTITVNVGSLAVGGTAIIQFQMYVDNTGLVPAGVHEKDNTASMTEAVTGPYTSNIITVVITSNANITVTKTPNPVGPVSPGDSIEYTIVVSSTGGSTATGLTVRDPVPTNTTYQLGSFIYEGAPQTDADDADNSTYDSVNNRVLFDLGDLTPGESRTMKFTVTVDSTMPNGTTTLTNTATAAATNTASKEATADVDVDAAPSLSLQKSAPEVIPYPAAYLTAAPQTDTPAAGQCTITVDKPVFITVEEYLTINGTLAQVVSISGNDIVLDTNVAGAANDPVYPTFEFVLSYQNTGDAEATNVQIEDVLTTSPANLEYIDADPAPTSDPGQGNNGTVTWSLGTISPDEGVSISLIVRPTSVGSDYQNYGTTSYDEGADFDSNTTSTDVGGIVLSKATTTPLLENTAAGVTGHYTITLTNQLAVADTVNNVTDYLPTGFTFDGVFGSVYNSSPAGSTCSTEPSGGESVPVWSNCSVPASGWLTIDFEVNIASTVPPGTYQNPVEAEGTALSVVPFDETATTDEDITIWVQNDFGVTKTVTLYDPTGLGGTLTYTIKITNLGSNDGTTVHVNDPLPAYVTYDSHVASHGTYDDATGLWDVTSAGNFLSGDQATLTIDATVNTWAFTENCAELDTGTVAPGDINPSNNKMCAYFGPTQAFLSSFTAYDDGGRVVVEWQTASETDTAGFYLYRYDGEKGRHTAINKKLLPALYTSPQGGTYSLVDLGAVPRTPITYTLVEMEGKGNRIIHGPFDVFAGDYSEEEAIAQSSQAFGENPYYDPCPSCSSEDEPQISRSYDRSGNILLSGGSGRGGGDLYTDYTREARGPSAERKARLAAAGKVSASSSTVKATGTAIKIPVSEDGLYFLDSAEIAGLLGTTETAITRELKKQHLALSCGGDMVGYLPSEDYSGLYFYGQKADSAYTGENVYWLTQEKGVQIEYLETGSLSSSGEETFTESLHLEEDTFPATGLFDEPQSDFWFWTYVVSGYSGLDSQSFTFEARGAADVSTPASLTVYLHSATDTTAAKDHHVSVSLNGTDIGDAYWDGQKADDFTFDFSQDLLTDGTNTIVLTGVLEDGVDYSTIYIDSFDVSYQRIYEAVDDVLTFRGEGHPSVTVSGFTSPEILLFDISQPPLPRLITGAAIGGSEGDYSVSFCPASADGLYLAATIDTVTIPGASAYSDAGLSYKQNAADYLVITTAELQGAARNLADYRQGQGLAAMVVLLEDIVDEFGYGVFTPLAIRDFLAYASANWKTVPRYVLLAGDGNFDYLNVYGYGGNLIPPALVPTPFGLYASDNYLADVDDDYIPEMAVGRLPVLSNDELQAMLDKIIAYEAAGGDWTNRIIWAADDPDYGGDFPTDADDLAAIIPGGYEVIKIYLSDYETSEAQAMLKAELNSGALMMNYIGHATLDRLANEKLLHTSDVSGLTNGTAMPVVAAFTCYTGNFSFANYECLGETLMLKSDGGAIAVWAPTGLSMNSLAKSLAQGYFEAKFEEGKQTLGDIVLGALEGYGAGTGSEYIMDIFTILGDPALILK